MDETAIKNDLIKLCSEVLEILKNARDAGILSEDEYKKHIKLKIEFLEINRVISK